MGGRRIIFLILMGVGVYGVWTALRMPIGKLQDQGPGLFPLGLAGILFILSILGLIFEKEGERASLDWKKVWKEFRIPLRIVLLTAGAIYFWELLGFFLICPLYLFLLFYWASGFRLRTALISGLSGGVLGWLFFAKFLGVSVPLGLLAF